MHPDRIAPHRTAPHRTAPYRTIRVIRVIRTAPHLHTVLHYPHRTLQTFPPS